MKKHILLKFKDFLEKCDNSEKQTLYDVLTALRGPDEDNQTNYIKQVFTCKIREILGFHPVIEVLPRKNTKLLIKQLQNAGHHWKAHTEDALDTLEKAGLISPKYMKFFNKIAKEFWSK